MIFDFNRALVREPGASVVRGLRATSGPDPTLEGVRVELQRYVEALNLAGVAVETLPALDEFPDAVFLEDPALVFGEGAIILRPGAPSRLGEAAAIAPELRQRFHRVLELESGFAEGGDILTTKEAVLIGLSARTDQAGAEGVMNLLGQLGRRGRIVHTPPGVLHFKTDCSLLDEETILATARLAASGVFEGHRVLLTPEGEEAAANALRVNHQVLVGSDFPRTAELLTRAGYAVTLLPNAQIARLDAGFSCLSLRWHTLPPRAIGP